MGFSQLAQEVETLLALLSYGAGVKGSGEVHRQVNTKEMGLLTTPTQDPLMLSDLSVKRAS